MNRWVSVLGVALCLLSASAGAEQQEQLRPSPTADQRVYGGVAPSVAQAIDGVHVQVLVLKKGDLFKVGVMVGNATEQKVEIVPEKIFMLNAYGRQLYRLSDNEVRAGWLRLANLPAPPPPPLRRYYTIEGSGTGNYVVQDLGTGYSTVTGGFSSSYHVEEHYDYSETLGFMIGSTIRHALDRRKARQQIEALDQFYLIQMDVPPQTRADRMVFFTAGAVSDKVPVTVVVFMGERQFKFLFTE